MVFVKWLILREPTQKATKRVLSTVWWEWGSYEEGELFVGKSMLALGSCAGYRAGSGMKGRRAESGITVAGDGRKRSRPGAPRSRGRHGTCGLRRHRRNTEAPHPLGWLYVAPLCPFAARVTVTVTNNRLDLKLKLEGPVDNPEVVREISQVEGWEAKGSIIDEGSSRVWRRRKPQNG